MSDVTLEQVTRLADELSVEDQLGIIEHLATRLKLTSSPRGLKPQTLRGIWRGHFPQDFDIDSALKDIRHKWEKEWPEVFGK
jgi:hypothetical protein